ncbi:Hpt domain-containing protein [Piscirickettsia litoralis]|uniref:Hpt domain-containing protein n=1 Tax=Piscirickettsia litoralis TaxID=1891921 RepID=UPI00084779E6|nr:Hpt domain-containing protein [Piscirickettsia litoralis]
MFKKKCNKNIKDVLLKPMSSDMAVRSLRLYGTKDSLINKCPDKSIRVLEEGENSEILGILMDSLPKTRKVLSQAYDNNDFENLYFEVHKLYGGLLYCSVPALKASVGSLKQKLVNKQYDDLTNSYVAMMSDLDELLRVTLNN